VAAPGPAPPLGVPARARARREDRFAARYRGKRYSFVLPGLPHLSNQRALFAALRPEEIGVHLTEAR